MSHGLATIHASLLDLSRPEDKILLVMLVLVVFAAAFALLDRIASRRRSRSRPARRPEPEPEWEAPKRPQEIYTPKPHALESPSNAPPPPTEPAMAPNQPGQVPAMVPPPPTAPLTPPTAPPGGFAPPLPPLAEEPPKAYPLPFSTMPSEPSARSRPATSPSDLGLDLPPPAELESPEPKGQPEIDPVTGLPVFKPRDEG
jgi:hypothetical protein